MRVEKKDKCNILKKVNNFLNINFFCLALDSTNLIKTKMKKIVTFCVIFFSFVATVNAQAAKKAVKPMPEAVAKQELYELSKVVDLNSKPDAYVNLDALLSKKQHDLGKENITEDEKQKITEYVESKLRSYFSAEEFKQIESTPGLLDNLLH